MTQRAQRLSVTDPRSQRGSRSPPRGWLRPLARAWANWRDGTHEAATPLMEEYEQRLMYSADLAPHGLLPATDTQPVEQRVLDANGDFVTTQAETVAQRVELLIVDGGVSEFQTLLNDLSNTDGRRIEVLILDAAADGVTQISAALAGRSDISALHILSHGAGGEIQLGSGKVDAAQLAARSTEIAQWGNALRADADILLYGCNVAADAQGQAFVQQLATLTGADVAASSNLTGNAALGGDWKLEYSIGPIENSIVLSGYARDTWAGTLATFTVTNASDAGAGSLRNAINAANVTPGADTITFNIAGPGVHTITPLSALIITDQITIDGYSQPGASPNTLSVGSDAQLNIRLDGNGLAASGLTFASGSNGSTVQGLMITRFGDDGISIASNSVNVVGNYIGTDGVADLGNAGYGIDTIGNTTNIGGNTPAQRNVISGNGLAGIRSVFNNANILGNYIGVNAAGTTLMPNDGGALVLSGVNTDVIGNLIVGSITGSGTFLDNFGIPLVVTTAADIADGDTSSTTALLGNRGADGEISLREAILATNNTPDVAGLIEPIFFNIAGAGVHTITLIDGPDAGTAPDALPTIIGKVVIDGYTQPGASANTLAVGGNANLLIEVNGNNGLFSGLRLGAGSSGSTIRGLVINNLSFGGVTGAAVEINGSSNNTITGNYLGTNFDGTLAAANLGGGVYIINGANNTIGGTTAATRNVISGNAFGALSIDGVSSTANLIQGNYIGTNASGTAALAGNGFQGVWIANGARNNTVGGSVAGARNVISGNAEQGIEVQGATSTNNILQGNYIGTNAAGTAALGNGLDGIGIENGVGTLILDNRIGGNGRDGIIIAGSSATGNIIRGNAIGTDATGFVALANAGAGIHFANAYEAAFGAPNNNTVGGVGAGQGNTIAFNGSDGVWVEVGTGNSIRGNQTYSNGGLGIDLGPNGVTTNDNNDVDSGANNLQNFPENLSYALTGTTLTVSGRLTSPTATYTLDFYIADTAVAGANGEGKTYIGSATVAIPPSGNFSGVTLTGVTVSGGQFITATATDAAGNTSEFSENVVIATAAPVNNVPGPQTVNEDSPLAFSLANGNLISVTDSNLNSVMLSVANGTINVTLAVGASISAGANGSSTLTISGNTAQINNTLANAVTYLGNLNFNGADILTITSTDATALTDIDTVAITVIPVNDAPTATNLSAAESYTEDSALNLTDIVISDIDSANVTATLTLSNAAAGSLNTAASGAVTSTYNAGTGVWTASGALADVNTLLAGLSFTPAANFNSNFSIATSISDGVAAAITGSKAITGVAVNDAPTATNLNAAETYTEDTALNLTDIVISDIDSASVTATLTLSNAAAGSLTTATAGAVTSTYNAGTGVWTASGALADVNTLLAGVSFTPTANFNSNFSIATSVSDGVAAAISGSKAITGVAVNDAPTATNLSAAETYTEDSALNLSDIVISDIDSASVTATLTLSNAAAGSLTTATAGAVTSTYNAGTGVWTASGALADVNTLLAGVSFTPAANFNSNFSIATSVSDGVAAAISGSKAITGVAVNDAPTATNLSAAETYTEDSALNLSDIVISDIDSASVTATLTLSNAAAGSLNTATSGAVTSTYNPGTGVWTASGALADVNTLLAGVSFTPAANFNSNFSIATSVSDGVAAAISGSKTITGVAVNDAPTATNLSAAETYTEDSALNLSDIVISDIDSASVTATLTLSNAAAGSLNTATSGAVTSTYNPGTGVWSAIGALADVNTLLAGVSFTPAANFNSNFSIATSVSDGVAAAISGSKAITGVAVNDAPSAAITSASYAATEQIALALQGTGLSVADVDVATGTVQVTVSAVSGTLSANAGTTGVTVGGSGAALTLVGNISQINNLLNGLGGASLTYTINSDTPPATDTLTLLINDQGNTGGGNLTAQDTAVIIIAAQNDAPLASPVTLAAIAEDSGVRLITSAELLSGVSDVDGPTPTISALTISSGAGTLVDNGNGSWTYSPALNDDTAVSFDYTATDGTLSAASTAVLDITPQNDAPLASPVTLSAIAEDSGVRLITSAELLAGVTDVDGPAPTISALTIASGAGTLVDNGNGSWNYTPALNDDTAVSFNYTATDGTLSATSTAALDITPVNDAPVNTVPGPQTVNEDTALAFNGANTLGVSDVDGNLAAVTLGAGNGTLNVTLASGATISAGTNNSNTLTLSGTPAQINAALATLTYQGLLNFNGADTLTMISVDDAAVPLSDSDNVIVTVAPVNDVALIGGAAAAAVTEDDLPINLATGGVLSVSDPDAGEAGFATQTGTVGSYGTFTLDGAGNWAYSAANNQAAIQQLPVGGTLTDSFAVTSIDNTATLNVVITIAGVNDVPFIGGTAAASVLEDAAPVLSASGLLSIADTDSGEAGFMAQANAAGTYGVFSVSATGAWTYTAANDQTTIQQLGTGATASDAFTVVSIDGTASRDVVVTINGVNDAPLASNQTVTTVSTVARVFAVSDFGYSDAEGDILASIRVVALPGVGALVLNGAPVAVNQEISAADLAAGKFSFIPDANVYTQVSTAFGIQVSDGTAYSAASYTVSLSVTPGLSLVNNTVTQQPSPQPPAAQNPLPTAVTPAAGSSLAAGAASGIGNGIAPKPRVDPVLPPIALLDNESFQQGVSRSVGGAEGGQVRSTGFGQNGQLGNLSFTLGLGAAEVRFDPLRPLDVSVSARTAAATASRDFLGELDRLRDHAQQDEVLARNIIVSSVATGAGMSVGYVLWLLRGGLLLSSLLSSLPAWRFVDPLPVLGRFDDDEEEDQDDDSVESMVRAGNQPRPALGEDERNV